MVRVVFGFLLFWIFLHGSVRGEDVFNASSQCTSGFISMDSLLTPPDNLRHRNRAQRIIPSLNFTCDGVISKWIIRAQWNVRGTAFPELQVWRSSSENGVYTKVGSTTLYASERNSSSLYEMAVRPSLPFQRGDTLGIFQPSGPRSRLRIRYINESGNPLNFVFRPNDSVTEAPLEIFTTMSSGVRRQTVLPFVTVEISRHMSSASPPSVSVTASARLSLTTTAPSLSTPSIADVLPTALPQPSSRVATTPSWPHQKTPQNSDVAAGVGSAVGVLALATMIALIGTTGILVAKSCEKKVNVDSEEPYYSTVNTGQQDATQSYDLEESYYSAVNIGQPDAIEKKVNDGYGRLQPT